MQPAEHASPTRPKPLVLQRSAEPGLDVVDGLEGHCTCGGECAECAAGAAGGGLPIGPPDDVFEREADEVAERVLAGVDPGSSSLAAGPLVQRACACGGSAGLEEEECAECAAGGLQRSAEGPAPAPVAPEAVHRALASPGVALDAPVRAALEPHFGDLGGVRIHTDGAAAASAGAINATAYTVGRDIVFAGGRYDPASTSGKRLLAHELTHVRQQTRGPEATVPRRRVQRSPGSPAGGCGICFGSPKAAGTEAHLLIEQAFASVYGPKIFPEFPVPPSPTDENGRLDLAMPIQDGFAIGEIKPANAAGLLAGDRDLLWYEQQLRRFNFRVERLALPPPPVSIPFIDPQAPECPQDLTVERWPAPGGIYLYSCEPDFSVLKPRCPCRRRRRRDNEPYQPPVPIILDRPVEVSEAETLEAAESTEVTTSSALETEAATSSALETEAATSTFEAGAYESAATTSTFEAGAYSYETGAATSTFEAGAYETAATTSTFEAGAFEAGAATTTAVETDVAATTLLEVGGTTVVEEAVGFEAADLLLLLLL